MSPEQSDDSTTVRALRSAVESFIRERDWKQYHSPQDLAVSISIEAAELLEIFQWKLRDDIAPGDIPAERLDRIKEELADVIIYALSLSNTLDLDVADLVMRKLELNEGKYPVEKCRGRAEKYTEL